jgi:predicted RNA-binding Zn-ribbon protein involved in translation (DUF1610 family)
MPKENMMYKCDKCGHEETLYSDAVTTKFNCYNCGNSVIPESCLISTEYKCPVCNNEGPLFNIDDKNLNGYCKDFKLDDCENTISSYGFRNYDGGYQCLYCKEIYYNIYEIKHPDDEDFIDNPLKTVNEDLLEEDLIYEDIEDEDVFVSHDNGVIENYYSYTTDQHKEVDEYDNEVDPNVENFIDKVLSENSRLGISKKKLESHYNNTDQHEEKFIDKSTYNRQKKRFKKLGYKFHTVDDSIDNLLSENNELCINKHKDDLFSLLIEHYDQLSAFNIWWMTIGSITVSNSFGVVESCSLFTSCNIESSDKEVYDGIVTICNYDNKDQNNSLKYLTEFRKFMDYLKSENAITNEFSIDKLTSWAGNIVVAYDIVDGLLNQLKEAFIEDLPFSINSILKSRAIDHFPLVKNCIKDLKNYIKKDVFYEYEVYSRIEFALDTLLSISKYSVIDNIKGDFKYTIIPDNFNIAKVIKINTMIIPRDANIINGIGNIGLYYNSSVFSYNVIIGKIKTLVVNKKFNHQKDFRTYINSIVEQAMVNKGVIIFPIWSMITEYSTSKWCVPITDDCHAYTMKNLKFEYFDILIKGDADDI